MAACALDQAEQTKKTPTRRGGIHNSKANPKLDGFTFSFPSQRDRVRSFAKRGQLSSIKILNTQSLGFSNQMLIKISLKPVRISHLIPRTGRNE